MPFNSRLLGNSCAWGTVEDVSQEGMKIGSGAAKTLHIFTCERLPHNPKFFILEK